MKYLITEDFETNIATINTALSLPSIEATNYCTPTRVTNILHFDYDKFIIPIKTEGRWKCDHLFNTEDLVDFDETWYSVI
jgi:hypothetical protein